MERLEETLARRLKELAQAKGLPLSHLADRAGVSRSYLWLLLAGRSSATLATVQRLAEVLEADPLELLSPVAALAMVAEPGTPGGSAKARHPGSGSRRRS